MRGTPSVWRRAERLAAVARRSDDLEAVARYIAAELGVTPEEVLAEAAEFGERCRAAGAVTVEETVEFVAAELGILPREVLADVRRLVEAVR